MHPVKISVIGAGGSFTIGLIHDICLTPSLHNSVISFMDTNAGRLSDQHEICSRYARQEMGIPLHIETTTDQKESLKGADFVVTIALIDGARRLKEGWDIAQKHGFRCNIFLDSMQPFNKIADVRIY